MGQEGVDITQNTGEAHDQNLKTRSHNIVKNEGAGNTEK